MSMQEYVRSYISQVSEQETMFRDLFGKEELEEVRKKGFTQSKPLFTISERRNRKKVEGTGW